MLQTSKVVRSSLGKYILVLYNNPFMAPLLWRFCQYCSLHHCSLFSGYGARGSTLTGHTFSSAVSVMGS